MKKEPIHRWHGAHHYSDRVHLMFVVFVFFAIFTLIWSYFSLASFKNDTQNSYSSIVSITPKLTPTPTQAQTPTVTSTSSGNIVCTQEALLCPDGKTYVGRTGPNCEFANCP